MTNVAVLQNGDMYIADGYGNARVHKFSEEGKLLFSWGEPGSGPASSCCRTASRWTARASSTWPTAKIRACRSSSPSGDICASGGISLIVPYDIFIDDQDMLHIAEGGFHNYMMKRSEGPLPAHDQTMIYPPCGHSPIARVTVCDPDGKIMRRLAARTLYCPVTSSRRTASGRTSSGDFYVGEVDRQRGRGEAHGAAKAAGVSEVS